MELTILHLCPDMMNLYGEYANTAVLRRRLEMLGVTVTVEEAPCGDRPDFFGADLVYMGAGTERKQKYALEALRPWREDLKEAIDRGAVLLFTGNAMETLGASGERFGPAWAWRTSPPWRRKSARPWTWWPPPPCGRPLLWDS